MKIVKISDDSGYLSVCMREMKMMKEGEVG
jgi:hypothetical protein